MRLLARGSGLGLALAALFACVTGAAQQGVATKIVASYQEPLPPPYVSKSSKASRSASLSSQQCLSEVKRRKLSIARFKGATVGVGAPVRVSGPIGGVRYVTPGKKSKYGILDCRLALALDDLAEVLRRHNVVEVRVDNMYRPRAKLPGRKKPSQHSYGLAIDLTGFKLADGTELSVERDFDGRLGEPVCGESARAQLPAPAGLLRDLICDVARSELFHHILTPNHDVAHSNHFHLDIKRGARQRIIK